MKIFALLVSLLLVSATALWADDVPFANPSKPQPGGFVPNVVSLGDIMGQTQTRHIKLWYAGQSGNWSLADYEIDRIGESLSQAASLYVGIPIDLVTGALEPLSEMRKAAKANNKKAFVKDYVDLTKACNACHEAGKVGFIKIQTPTSLPFTDESFAK
jgi:hypothetical protein